jgi:hypothetical protein
VAFRQRNTEIVLWPLEISPSRSEFAVIPTEVI